MKKNKSVFDVETMRAVCLAHLYEQMVENDRHGIPIQDLSNLLGITKSYLLLGWQSSINGSAPLVTSSDNKLFITPSGLSRVEGQIKEQQKTGQPNPTTEYLSGGLDGIRKLDIAPHVSSSLDVSDQDWQPLKIDRESSQFKEAVGSLESAIQTIQGDNGFADALPDVRKEILSSLEQGAADIKSGNVTLGKIKEKTLRPLKWLAEKFSGAIIGEAAKAAFIKLIAWLSGL